MCHGTYESGRLGVYSWRCTCGCCGCGCGGFHRRFISKREEIEMLEEYRECLQKELAGLEELLKELKE